MVTVKAGALADLVRDIFAKAGCSAAEAERIGKYLVSANLTGHDSHGVVRVPRYVHWKKDGTVIADREVKIVTETPVLAVVDGLHGFGQTVAPQAVAIGIDKCRKNGLSMVALRNAGHIGRVGDWAEMAAEAGLVSVHFVNASGSVLVAPFGGTERRLSTAPFVRRRAAPRPDAHHPRFRHLHRRRRQGAGGEPGRQEAARERADRPRRQDGHRPAPALWRLHRRPARAITPRARAPSAPSASTRAPGLALMCELLGGSLTGMSATGEGRRFGNGMLSFYIDPKVVDPEAMFSDDVARYIAYFKSAKPATAGGEVLVPGEPEQRMRAQRSKDGVPLPDDTWASILATAREVGVDENRIQQAERRHFESVAMTILSSDEGSIQETAP